MRTNLKAWRESASLIIAAKSNFCQPTQCDYKLLCIQRSSKSKFMPNTYVFPGGNISKGDGSSRWLEVFEKVGYKLNSFEELYPRENVPPILKNADEDCLPKYLSLRICAIRETFEECGILICKSAKVKYNRDLTNWASYIGGHEILKWQHRVHDDPNEFLNLCSQLDLYPDVWALQNWSNWMTPPSKPIRFDAMFFFSSFHQMPDAHEEKNEVQDIKWATPSEYIAENLKKKIMLPIPQFYEISRMKNFDDITALSQYASERSCYGCERYLPHRIAAADNSSYAIFPGDGLYQDNIDNDNINIPVLDEIPQCKVKNRLLLKGHWPTQLIIENFVPKDKHLPPVKTFS